jgi:hypothetical protein
LPQVVVVVVVVVQNNSFIYALFCFFSFSIGTNQFTDDYYFQNYLKRLKAPSKQQLQLQQSIIQPLHKPLMELSMAQKTPPQVKKPGI